MRSDDDCSLTGGLRITLLLPTLAVLLLLLLPAPCQADRHVAATAGQPESINISAPEGLLKNPASRNAVHDTLGLLRRGFPRARVSLNAPGAKVRMVLSAPDSPCLPLPVPATARSRSALLPCSDQGYRWDSRRKGGTIELTLRSASPQGAACGLYGLLQEKLGYRFIHPRRTIIPRHEKWPLPLRFQWAAAPRFEKRGFHLHTLHPTELAEQLNNPEHPAALSDVKEYLDWLARNGQNVMQFQLLRGALTPAWTNHAARMVQYAHQRGIMLGVAFSLSMIQQRSFQTVNLLRPFPPYRRQIDDSLSRLFRVKWDFVTVDFTMGEYLPDLGTHLPAIKDYLISEVTGRYRTPLFQATHVIRRKEQRVTPAPGTGILIHTVMNYALSDAKAPVYGNPDLRFMLDRAVLERKSRETWFWPESSYWIAYDSSVPLFLLTYLDARWRDMNTMEGIGLPGHLTFSSGWEWGYWLIDWSIARWSWRDSENHGISTRGPLGPLEDIFPDRGVTAIWREALSLENRYLKERELIRHLSAATPFAELPRPFGRSFQPAPEFSSARLLRGSTGDEADRAAKQSLADLDEYAALMESLVKRLDRETGRWFGGKREGRSELHEVASELRNCLAVSALRARHRALTIRALLAVRDKVGVSRKPGKSGERFLNEAAATRLRALELVRAQERRYRYPVQAIARPGESMTAYRFGYLYPVSGLYFWEREEEQIRQRRFDPLFMNLWDFRRVLGAESLLF